MVEQRQIWDHFQGDGISAFDGNYPRLLYLLNLVSAEESKILNIGVGNGAFEKLALQQGKDIYSLDPSEVAIDRLVRELDMGERAKVGFSQNMPFPDNCFDVIVISEVLEHLDEGVLGGTLHEVRRVLKLNGRMIGTVPAKENLDEQTAICPNCGEQFHRWGHVQSFNQNKLQQLLERYFEDVQINHKYFVSWSLLNFKGKFLVLTKLFLLKLNVHGGGENLVFRVKKSA